MKHITNNPRLASLRLWLLLGLFCSAISVQAATYYFLGNGNGVGARAWTNGINWTLTPSGGSGGAVLTNANLDNDLVFGNYHTIENTLRADNGGGNPSNGGGSGATANVNSMTFTCNGWGIFVKDGVSKIVLGAGGITNNPANITGAPTAGAPGSQIVNSFRNYMELGANATIWNFDTNQQLTIRQDATDFTAGNFFCLDNKGFSLTFDGPGTNNFNTITAGTHAGGAVKGTGGIIKNGTGATTFGATNTYTGSTVINQGLLGVRSMCSGGGSYTVANGATFQVTMNSPAVSLRVSSLNVTSTTTNSLNLAMTSVSSVGNPTSPIIYATNLTLNGTIYLTLAGSGLNEGVIPLIQYNGSIAGGGTMLINSLPTGVSATLTNNTAAKQWQLVVTSVPALLWVGKTNTTLAGNWDLSGTTNWVNTDTGLPAPYANGLPVLFNDTGFTNVVTLVTNVAPFSLTVSNNSLTYTLTNNNGVGGFGVIPTGSIIKDGTGTFNLGTSNNYNNAYTYIKQGTLRTTVANAIGRAIGQSGANLTNNATLDMFGFSQNIGGLYGSGVITNSTSTPVILQAQAGAVDGGSFSGKIDEGTSGGTLQLNKASGVLTLSGNNNYSGGTHFVAGGAAANRQIILGGNNVLGTGPLVYEINSILSADANPRTLTNSIFIQNINAGMIMGGTGSGLLTLSGPINVNATGGDQDITFASDVVFSGPFTCTSGGVSTKSGPGTLRLRNNTVTWLNLAADSRISDGTMIVDAAALSVIGATTPNFRVQSLVTNGTASLFITNGGSLTVGNINGYADLNLGNASSAPGTTNIADVRGTLVVDQINMGDTGIAAGGGALARLNLQSSSQTTVRQITTPTNCTAITEINLDGATITAIDDASSSFLQGMTNVFVKSGGVTIDCANTNSIHVRQNLLNSGGGGLTKVGAGTLQLDGVNTYSGTTLISTGGLGGIGTIAGPVVIAGGATLIPGGGGNIGTLTVNNLTLNAGAQVTFELNNTNDVSSATNDYLVVSGVLSITSSSLTVQNDGTNLVAGDSFKLFSVPVTGGFTNVSLPTLDAGLAWNNKLAVDGSIEVIVAPSTPPNFQPGGIVMLPDGNFSLTATGALGANFRLWASTNVAATPVTNTWTLLNTGTITVSPFTINDLNATNFSQRFYLFSTP